MSSPRISRLRTYVGPEHVWAWRMLKKRGLSYDLIGEVFAVPGERIHYWLLWDKREGVMTRAQVNYVWAYRAQLKRAKLSYKRHTAKVAIRQKARYVRMREDILEGKRAYYATHADEVRAKRRKRYADRT